MAVAIEGPSDGNASSCQLASPQTMRSLRISHAKELLKVFICPDGLTA
jgi:hypothetical protein